jgi:putative ABC transport system permease protein
MKGDVNPPRLAGYLLGRVLSHESRDAAAGDLDEEFRQEVLPRVGAAHARLWYWRQVLSLSTAYAMERLRTRHPWSFGSKGDTMRHDIRDALRTIVRSPGYSLITIAVLALGIGATSAIFSFVDGVLLRPLPYADPERIVIVWEKPPGGTRNSVSTENFRDWQRQNDVFDIMVASTGMGVTMSGATEPIRVRGSRVSAGYFDIFGVRPALGRTFARAEDQPGKEKVAVITHRFWQRVFGGDPTVIGRSVVMNGEPHTIVGVMPAGSAFDRGTSDIWRPLAFGPGEQTRNYHWLQVLARLKPGVTVEQARARMDAIGAQIAVQYPESNKDWGVTVERFVDVSVNASLKQSLQLLMAAVAMLLLVGCANLANLALARGTSREREITVRAALGASRWRLVRQFLTESLVLSIVGGILGVAVGYAMMRGLKLLLPPFFLPREAMVTIDLRALLFVLGMSVATGLLFGTAPAFHAGRADLAGSMKGSSRAVTSDRFRRRVRDGLVVIEVALACMLLVGSGLLMRSFLRMQQVEAARDPATLLTANLLTTDARFAQPDEARVFYRQVLERASAVPGVKTLALTSALPMQGWGYGMPLRIGGRPAGAANSRGGAGFKMVTPSYFEAIGLPIIRGRGLQDTDRAASVPAIVVNQAFADRYFQGEDPIGKHVLIEEIVPGRRQLGPEIPWEIVGVVGNELVGGLTSVRDRAVGVYVSIDQQPIYGLSLVARASSEASVTAAALKAAVHEVDPNQPFTDVRTIAEIKNESAAPDRLRTWLIVLFGVTAGLLAAIGIYGVISYSVAQRTHEIGLRAALGANRRRLMGLVMGRATILTVLGLTAGLAAAMASTRLIATLLFGVDPRDVISLAGATLLLGVVAMVAAYVPARRAAAVDPLVALRVE